jgi:hypothetical protein
MDRRARVLDWCTELQGSKRAVGLLRFALAAIVLIRYGDEVAFFAADDTIHASLAIYFFVFTPLMLVGLYTRVAVPMVALTLAWMYLLGYLPDRVGWNHHHSCILMISVLFLAFTGPIRSTGCGSFKDRSPAVANRDPNMAGCGARG